MTFYLVSFKIIPEYEFVARAANIKEAIEAKQRHQAFRQNDNVVICFHPSVDLEKPYLVCIPQEIETPNNEIALLTSDLEVLQYLSRECGADAIKIPEIPPREELFSYQLTIAGQQYLVYLQSYAQYIKLQHFIK